MRYWCQFSWETRNLSRLDDPAVLNHATMCDHAYQNEGGRASAQEAWEPYGTQRDAPGRGFTFRIIAAESDPYVRWGANHWLDYTPVTRWILGNEAITPHITPYLLPNFATNPDSEITTMPADPAAAADLAATLAHTPDSLVRAKIVRDMATSRLTLVIDAKPLHELLERMGVKTEGGANGSFAGRPGARFSVASSDFQVSTEVLLNRRYPASYSLSAIWTEPPTIPQLKKLGESIHTAVRKILEHYRPIDISFSLVKVAADDPKGKTRDKAVF